MSDQSPEGGTPPVQIVISYEPETEKISVSLPSTLDPLLTFQLLSQVAHAQIPGFCTEVVRLREMVAAQMSASGIVTAGAVPDGLVGPMDPPSNLREFRRRN